MDVLRGLSLRRLGEGATESTIGTKAELIEVLGDVFGIDVAALDRAAVDAMWTSVRAAHEVWDQAGRPQRASLLRRSSSRSRSTGTN